MLNPSRLTGARRAASQRPDEGPLAIHVSASLDASRRAPTRPVPDPSCRKSKLFAACLSGRSGTCHESAVDGECVSGDPGSIAGSKEGDRGSDVLGFADASERVEVA
jgi:hypothetical protein